MSLIPPYDASMQKIMNQWLLQKREPTSDRDFLELAAWLDGRSDVSHIERVELLLASDTDLLRSVLALPEMTTEPVPACDLLAAQALVTGRAQRSRMAKLSDWFHNWQPLPMAAAAMFSVLVVAGSTWMGRMAAAELGMEDMQVASQQQITQLDFVGLDSVVNSME